MELTPLGIMGPLFSYPRKLYDFTGIVSIHTDPPEAESRIRDATSFRIEGEKGSTKVHLDFMKGVEDALKTTGRSIEYSPESIEVTVTCADTECQVTSNPDVISSDGLVRLESREVSNQARLRELAEEQAAAKRKQNEAEERERRPPNPYCDAIASAHSATTQMKSCLSVDSQYRVAWHGHKVGEPVDIQVCLRGSYAPFSVRQVDPRTGETKLLSLTAANGTAVAITPSGKCLGDVKVLLTPDLAKVIGGSYSLVSARVRGTYEGLYPPGHYVSGMEPMWLLILATNVQRVAPQRGPLAPAQSGGGWPTRRE